MQKIFNKASALLVFPVLFAAATSPLACSCISGKDGGIFKSDSYGAGWQQKVKISDKKSIASANVLSMAIDLADPNIIYLGTDGNGIYKTTDSAETWVQIADKKKVLNNGASVYDIKINPNKPSIVFTAVYQGGYGRVLKSEDSGESWQEVYRVASAKIPVRVLEIDKINDSLIYIGTAEGMVLKSADQGNNWQKLGMFNDQIVDIKIDPNNDQIIYFVAASKGLNKSVDQGMSWQALSYSSSTSKYSIDKYTSVYSSSFGKSVAMMIDGRSSEILYAATEKNLLVSYNGGSSWQSLNILMPPSQKSTPITSIAQDPQNPNVIYYGASSIIYRSNDDGNSWNVNQAPSSRSVKFIKIDPLNTNIIYAGMHQ